MIIAHSPLRTCSGKVPTPSIATRLLIRITDDGNLKIPLDKDVLTIGRHTTNDICIVSRYISRSHARIINLPAGAIIEDLDSHNGIAINTHRVRYWQLRSGDLIDLGAFQLRYIDLAELTTGDGHA